MPYGDGTTFEYAPIATGVLTDEEDEVVADGDTIEHTLRANTVFNLVVRDALGALEDISGKTIYFTVKANVDDADIGEFQKVLDLTVPLDGEAQLNLLPADFVDQVKPGRYYADVKYIHTATTNVYEIWRGWLLIKGAVTHSVT